VDAAQFLQNYDKLVAVRGQIADDRRRASDRYQQPRNACTLTFCGSFGRQAGRVGNAAQQGCQPEAGCALTSRSKAPRFQKPATGTGTLAQDAASYITSYKRMANAAGSGRARHLPPCVSPWATPMRPRSRPAVTAFLYR